MSGPRRAAASRALGETVNTVLVAHFPRSSTPIHAHMEEELDEIAQANKRGRRRSASSTLLRGDPQKASVEMVKMKEPDQPLTRSVPTAGLPMVIRMGRFGKFLPALASQSAERPRRWPSPTNPGAIRQTIQRQNTDARDSEGREDFPEKRNEDTHHTWAEPQHTRQAKQGDLRREDTDEINDLIEQQPLRSTQRWLSFKPTAKEISSTSSRRSPAGLTA